MMTDIFIEQVGDAVALAFPYAATPSENTGASVAKVTLDDDSADYILWGADNLWPQKTWKELEANDVAPMVIDWKKRALISGGLIYGAKYVENGVEKFKQLMIDEVESFIEESCINTIYLPTAAHNLYTYKSFYPYFAYNKALDYEKKRINELYCDDSQFCRMGKQTEKLGHIKKVFVSGNFEDEGFSPKDLKPFTAIDRYGNIMRQMREAKGRVYYPMYTRINGNIAYDFPSYYGVIKSKWLELAKHIPIWKASIMSNQATVKYQFIFHEQYWPLKYKETWDKATEEERFGIKREEVRSLLSNLTGTEKAGNALFTETIFDEESKTYVPLLDVKRIDTGKAGGDYIEDSQEADFHVIRAFGVDPTLIGQTPGSKMGSGSGSDKRVAFNHYIILCKPDQDALLEPMHKVAAFNGWHELAKKEAGVDNARLVFRLKNYHIAKLELGQEVADADGVTSNGDKKTEE